MSSLSTTSSNKPIIAIVGATGSQGGSLLNELYQTNQYHIRALTRNINSDKANKLKDRYKNIELIKCDINNENDLKAAFKDASIVFGVTNFWDSEIQNNNFELEYKQGIRLVDVASDCGVKYFIWSSLPDYNTESNGKYPAIHFDAKHRIQEYIMNNKPNLKGIYFHAAFYYQNLQTIFPPIESVDSNGETIFTFAFPINSNSKIAWFDVNDTGKILKVVLENPDLYINKEISSAGEELTGNELATTFTNVTGKKAQFKSLTEEEFKKMIPGAVGIELYNMYQFWEKYGYFGKLDPFIGKKLLNNKSVTWKQFLTTIQ